MDNAKVLTRGQFVLLTAGDYSSYGVQGLYEVLEDVDVPFKPRRGRTEREKPDISQLSTNPRLREITYIEVWESDD